MLLVRWWLSLARTLSSVVAYRLSKDLLIFVVSENSLGELFAYCSLKQCVLFTTLCYTMKLSRYFFVNIRIVEKGAFKLRLECLFLRSQYLHVNFSTLHVVCQYVSKIISRFQKFCRIFLSERKMSTLIFSVYACVRWNWPKLRKKYFFSEWISFRKKNEYDEFQSEYEWVRYKNALYSEEMA